MGFEGFSSHLKKKTQYAPIIKTNRERFNEEKSAVLYENYTKELNTQGGRNAKFIETSLLLGRERTIRTAILSVVGGAENWKVRQLSC